MPTLTTKGYVWKKKELEYLEIHFQIDTNKQLAEYFGVGWRTIVRKARELNLEKHELFRIQLDFVQFGKEASKHPKSIATRWKKGVRNSPQTEFKKGHKPIKKQKVKKLIPEINFKTYEQTQPIH